MYKLTFGTIALLSFWYYTQNIKQEYGDVDRIHDLLLENEYIQTIYNYLQTDKSSLLFLLVSSSLLIDITTIHTIYDSVRHHNMSLLFSFGILLLLRQINQFITFLPAPKDPPLWLDPGVPSIIVTYQTHNDYFFSGHTSISTLLAYNLYLNTKNEIFKILLVLGVIYEIFVLLVTHSHYTMDIYTGLLTGIISKHLGESFYQSFKNIYKHKSKY